MKTLVPNYTFNASAKTITFLNYPSISLDGLLLVTNTTDNIIIYNFASAGKGGTVSGNVLTLDYDTTSMDNSDNLQIFYDDPSTTDRFNGRKQSYVFTYTSAGNHDAVVPASGKKIRVYWVSFIPNSGATESNVVSVGFGNSGGGIDSGQEFYRNYAQGHYELFEGATNKSVIISTENSEKIVGTIHYQEVA